MEAFSALLVLCEGNLPVTGEFPSQSPVTRSYQFSLICAWINCWVNNREAGDLRRHRNHYDVTVMIWRDLSWVGEERVQNVLYRPNPRVIIFPGCQWQLDENLSRQQWHYHSRGNLSGLPPQGEGYRGYPGQEIGCHFGLISAITHCRMLLR